MIASAYETGVEFFIQKPINSVEVENVIKKVGNSLNMQRTMSKMQNIFMEGMQPETRQEPAAYPAGEHSAVLRNVLQQLGIHPESWKKAKIMAASISGAGISRWWRSI